MLSSSVVHIWFLVGIIIPVCLAKRPWGHCNFCVNNCERVTLFYTNILRWFQNKTNFAYSGCDRPDHSRKDWNSSDDKLRKRWFERRRTPHEWRALETGNIDFLRVMIWQTSWGFTPSLPPTTMNSGGLLPRSGSNESGTTLRTWEGKPISAKMW